MRPHMLRSGAFFFSLTCAATAHAQANCGSALAQLQNYAAQVNQIANFEMYNGIPMRCAGNPMCANYWYAQLNNWYAMQSNSVNGWYQQIAYQCSSSKPTPLPKTSPGKIPEERIEELEVDNDDKTVVLKIPDNPDGFVPGGE